MNNIIRFLLKKNVIQDLARVSHNLDLSSPNMAATVNAALKPLETLSRVINQPTTILGGRALPTKTRTQGSGTVSGALPTSESANDVDVDATSTAAVIGECNSTAVDDITSELNAAIAQLDNARRSLANAEINSACSEGSSAIAGTAMELADGSFVDDDLNTGPTTTTTTSESTNAILEATIEDITDNTDNDGLALEVSGTVDALDAQNDVSQALQAVGSDSSYPLQVSWHLQLG